MSRKLMIDKFCIDYSWRPTAQEKKHFQDFCDGIRSDEILKKVLDPINHPKTESGRVFRPNNATLGWIARQFIQETSDSKRRDEMSVLDGDECFYCTAGYVMDVYEGARGTFSRVRGRCRCKRGDYTGQFSKRTPVEPSPEVQDYARKGKMICARAVDEMVRIRSQALISPERKAKNLKIRGKGESLGEIVKEIPIKAPDDEYELEDTEIPF